MIGPPKIMVEPTTERQSGGDERRDSERFAFSAVAEAIDISSRVRVTARVSDISRTGCYLDVMNVFVPSTKIQLTVSHGNLQFNVAATVIYSLPAMGMGVTFNSVDLEMSAILERWIAELKGEIVPARDKPTVNRIVQDHPRVERHILGRLIGLMVRKNLLARKEGTDLLDELLRENQE